MIPFTHAILDFNKEIIRKVRWTSREAKWFKEANSSFDIIKLKQPEKVNVFNLIKEEAPF